MNRAEKKRLLKGVSIAAIVIILAAVGLSYVISSYIKGALNEMQTEFIDTDADVALGRIDQTSTRNGRVEWRLTADVATYDRNAELMKLTSVMVYFYPKNGAPATLTADRGSFQSAAQNFSVNDNVVVKTSEYEMRTSELLYLKEQDTLIANQPLVITSGDSRLEADSMLLEVENQKLFMEGNVKVFLTPEFMASPPTLNVNQ